MNTTAQSRRRWPVKLTGFAFFAGILAAILLAIAGPGYRLGVFPLAPALLGAGIGFLLFVVTFIVGTVGLLSGGRLSYRRPRAATIVVLLSMVIVLFAGFWVLRTGGAPAIHDVTTDSQNPPAFKAIVPLRVASGAVNPAEYQRAEPFRGTTLDVPAAQRKAFPDIQPLVLPQAPTRAVQLAQQAARDMGWEIVAVAPEEGRVEATDTTAYFGFKDDVVVRVVPESAGSRVDVRSESRVGLGDAGTNARRVRRYLAKLRELAGSSSGGA
jgi:uncharacterized protein (DUF1499 family)